MRVNLTNDDPRFHILRAAEGEDGAEGDDPPETPPKEEAVKPDWRDRRIARLTAEKRALEARVSTATPAKPAETAKPEEVDREKIREEERQRIAAEARTQEFNDACNAVVARGKKQFDDWDDTIKKIGNSVGPLAELEQKHGFVTFVLDTSNPEKVIYELGQDPDRMEEVLSMRPGKMIIELEKIAKAKPRKEISEVDPPPGHIDGGTGGVRNPLTNVKAPMADYAKARNAELLKRAQAGDNKARRLLGQTP